MNLIEAVKSGNDFYIDGGPYINRSKDGYEILNIPFEFIVRDDWKIKEKKVDVTRDQLWNLWKQFQYTGHGTFEKLCKELGL